jgi:hypothetical protein
MGLSTWLALARSFQLLGSLAATAMHGYLTIRVYNGRLGLSKEMVVLELLVCSILPALTPCAAKAIDAVLGLCPPWLLDTYHLRGPAVEQDGLADLLYRL